MRSASARKRGQMQQHNRELAAALVDARAAVCLGRPGSEVDDHVVEWPCAAEECAQVGGGFRNRRRGATCGRP
jgi:hypothetical protein